MKTGKLYLVILFFSFFFTDAVAQMVSERESLRGLDGVRVVVEPLSSDAKSGGLSESQLKTDTELRLRRNSVRVTQSPYPYLYVRVTALRDTTASGRELGYSAVIEVSLVEKAMLIREPFHTVSAETWSITHLNSSPDSSSNRQRVREVILDYVDEFSNDYLAMNPKQ